MLVVLPISHKSVRCNKYMHHAFLKKLNFSSLYSDPLVKFIEFLIFLRGKHNMYIVVTEAIDNGPSLLNTVFDYLSGPSVVIPVLIIMT